MFSFNNIEEENKSSNYKFNIYSSPIMYDGTKWIVNEDLVIRHLDHSQADSGKPNNIVLFQSNNGKDMTLNLTRSLIMKLKETRELRAIGN